MKKKEERKFLLAKGVFYRPFVSVLMMTMTDARSGLAWGGN